MRKNYKAWRKFWITVCLLNCVLIDWFLLTSDNSNIQIDILSILEIIIIFVNFVFVVWVYFKDEQKQSKQDYIEKKKYWYHDVLIERNMPLVQELFTESIGIIDEIGDKEDFVKVKALLRKVKDKRNALDRSIGFMMNAYDPELYKNFSIYLRSFEDEVTTKFVVFLKENDRSDYIASIRKIEAEIMALLMEYDFDLGKNKTKTRSV